MSKKRFRILEGGLHYRLHQMISFGESKHEYKRLEREAYLKSHNGSLQGWNPSSVPGKIFSVGTYLSYKKALSDFAMWLSKNSSARNVSQISKVDAIKYLKEKDAHCSAFTVSLDMSSINKIFPEFQLTKRNVGLKERRLSQITRSRNESRLDKWHEKKYKIPLTVARGTGCRRRELEALTPNHFIRNQDGKTVAVKILNGKGGRKRIAPLLNTHKDFITNLVDFALEQDPTGTQLLFGHLPNTLDIHACRSEYCMSLLHQLTTELKENQPLCDGDFDCHSLLNPKTKDILDAGLYKNHPRKIVRMVSGAMGHSRTTFLQYYVR